MRKPPITKTGQNGQSSPGRLIKPVFSRIWTPFQDREACIPNMYFPVDCLVMLTDGQVFTFFGLTSSGAQIGIPLLAAGASTLIPILTLKDKYVTYNSLALSRHGKAIGLYQGAALGLLFTGDEVNDGKLIIGIATLSSIGLGRLGYNLGRDKTWSQGRVALYAHYGFLMPLEGLAVDLAFNLDNARAYAADIPGVRCRGYLLADRIARWNDFTKGDVRSTRFCPL